MKKNYYDVLVFNEITELNEVLLKKVTYEIANLKVKSLRRKGKKADIWYGFDKYASTEITKDNIHLYYEFMSDEDLEKYKIQLHLCFTQRISVLKNVIFGADTNKKFKFKKENDLVLSYSLFGIKDTLKPMDEYIEEIEESSEYKEYIFNLDFDNLDFDSWNALKDFIEKYRKIHINLMEHIERLRYMAKQIKEEYISTK